MSLISPLLRTCLVYFERDARTAGEIKGRNSQPYGDLELFLMNFSYRPFFVLHLNGGHGVAGNQENCENDELAHTRIFFFIGYPLKRIKKTKAQI